MNTLRQHMSRRMEPNTKAFSQSLTPRLRRLNLPYGGIIHNHPYHLPLCCLNPSKQLGLLQTRAVEIDNLSPSEEVLEIWHKADAVCFDVDCTVTVNDGLDLLAEYMGVGKEVEELTNKAMEGTMDLEDSLKARLKIIDCKPGDIRGFLKEHPPTSRLAPGIENLISDLQARGVKVYLISGGFRELMLPIAAHLNIPPENVFANRMLWQWDDMELGPTRLAGFDLSEPTARQMGKPEAIARIREQYPHTTVVMVGDGITDLEALEGTSNQAGADLFIGYGGVVEREKVKAGAHWYVYDHEDLVLDGVGGVEALKTVILN